MASVLQLEEVSWLVVCAACCHMTLGFVVMHLLFFFFFLMFIASVHSFFFFFLTFLKSGIDKSTEWST